MTEEMKLNQLHGLLGSLEYPMSNADVREVIGDVTVLYADGEEPLADVVARSNAETFESPADLEAEIFSNVAIDAVGEPGQSEGEG